MIFFCLFWFAYLSSGYGLGQIVHGTRVVMSENPQNGDIGRGFAHFGLATATMWPVRISGVLGMAGCISLLLRKPWALYLLVIAAVVIVWPIAVWIVALVFWNAIDPAGSGVLFTQTAVTTIVAFGLPLAVILRRHEC